MTGDEEFKDDNSEVLSQIGDAEYQNIENQIKILNEQYNQTVILDSESDFSLKIIKHDQE